MELIRGLRSIRPRHKGCVVTIGNFDGVHHGHQVLLAHLNAKRDELGVPSQLITFEPTPREFFRGETVPARLTRFREKICVLEQTGIDRVLLFPFNERTAATPAQWVVDELLVNQLGVKYIVVGDDFRFGRGAEGDYAMLKEAGDQRGFEVSHLGTLTYDHDRVSSSKVRELLAAGQIRRAEKLLGREYFIMGRVVYGRQLGRQLGVPTANIRLQRYRSAVEGVFAVSVHGLDKSYPGIANIGIRPTVDGKEPLLEAHLFDFDGDIYGRLLKVNVLKKIRDEIKFESIDVLKRQIDRDIAEVREFFAAQ